MGYIYSLWDSIYEFNVCQHQFKLKMYLMVLLKSSSYCKVCTSLTPAVISSAMWSALDMQQQPGIFRKLGSSQIGKLGPLQRQQ